MPAKEVDLKKELEFVATKLELVKRAGHGEVIIRVAGGKEGMWKSE